MVSALDQVTASRKDERKLLRYSGDRQTSSLQQPKSNTAKQYALDAIRQSGHGSRAKLLEYESVIKLVEYLRHRNPDCGKTIDTYLAILKPTLEVLKGITPDDLVRAAKKADDDQLEALFLELDDHWLEELNSTATRISKWAMLKTFLVASGVRKANVVKCNIRNRKKTIDYALTRDDCRKILDHAKATVDKLTVALQIESMQRIGTINLLTWGDMKPHLDKGEDIFLVWIDPKRTKRNIAHWAPIGPLSSYYMRKRLAELAEKGIEVTDETPLITNQNHRQLTPVSTSGVILQIHRIMMLAGVVGRKQGQGHMTRYEKHGHSFRKFGVVEMQRAGANEQIIRFLMGQKRDAYSEWTNRYDELLEIYREKRPRLDQKQALDDTLEFGKAIGCNFDPKPSYQIGISELIQTLTETIVKELKRQGLLTVNKNEK